MPISIIAETKIVNDFLTIPEIIQERLSINKHSKIDFVVKQEGIMIQVSNSPAITVKRTNQFDEEISTQLTLIRHDFVCKNPKCNNPILNQKRQYCCRACIFKHQRMTSYSSP